MERMTPSAAAGNGHAPAPSRPASPRKRVHARWMRNATSGDGLWVFGYGSLIWRPDLQYSRREPARVHGWHRALSMWSRVNRGTPERPGLVFALLSGGSCCGVVYRVQTADLEAAFDQLWEREMPTEVYDPRWLSCTTPEGPVEALAFTLPRRSPAYTGPLTGKQYAEIFRHSRGRYGTTLDYARQTYDSLSTHGINDRHLAALLRWADADRADSHGQH